MSACIGIADLERELFLPDRLSVKVFDNVVADRTILKTKTMRNNRIILVTLGAYRANPTPRLLPFVSLKILFETTTYPVKMSCMSYNVIIISGEKNTSKIRQVGLPFRSYCEED